MSLGSEAGIEVVLHGALSKHAPARGRVSLTPDSIEGFTAMDICRLLGIPEKMVSFVARNGIKCSKEEFIYPGDKLDVFPPMIGG